MAVRVAVDAMGGDHAPGEVISGAIRAVRQADGDLKVLLYGPEPKLRAVLAAHEPDPRISVVHAPDVIGMGEVPVAAVRAKPRSSIHLGLRGHRAGAADAFLSAGNTGAVVAASLFLLKRLSGAKRPSIPSFFRPPRGPAFYWMSDRIWIAVQSIWFSLPGWGLRMRASWRRLSSRG